jgi:glutaminyl-tRNA synthetase
LPAEVRLYNPLFLTPVPGSGGGDIFADLNPQSVEILSQARVEPSLAQTSVGTAVQFERQGYFCPDPDSAPGKLVFNRTVGLRDTWAKVAGSGP